MTIGLDIAKPVLQVRVSMLVKWLVTPGPKAPSTSP
jgi:hypothetical protein